TRGRNGRARTFLGSTGSLTDAHTGGPSRLTHRPEHYPGSGCTLRRTIPLSPWKLPLCVIPRADLLQPWFPASPTSTPRRAWGELGWLASTASVWVLLRSVREYQPDVHRLRLSASP